MMDFNKTKPWWRTDSYLDETPVSQHMQTETGARFGPKGPALVALWTDGTTQKGWGRDEFMGHYKHNRFNLVNILHGYKKDRWNYAWIMRSARIVCIDIDGKNGGLEHASALGHLPPTLAETSKSGNGYHLFYEVDDEWDEDEGFAGYRDHIGIVTGVDIRGTGCVYHYPQQRWNDRPLAKLPAHLVQRLTAKAQAQANASANIQKVLELDPEEIAIMHDELLTELDKPIAPGKRNITLFAIGAKLEEAQVPNWQDALKDKGSKIGLDDEEVDKIVANIEKYGKAE